MANLLRVFSRCQTEGRAAAVAFTVAGYPTKDATVDILLAMQRGGIDIVELGIPSSDPIGDGPIIQDAHAIAVRMGCNFQTVLGLVRGARQQGLVIPLVLMGYCNPVLQYGLKRATQEAAQVGVDGFLLADLPVTESVYFRSLCRTAGLSYIPVISPTMKDARIELLSQAADTYLYVLSKMGVTGSSGEGASSGILFISQFLDRLRHFSGNKPLAFGLGVSTREQFLNMQGLAPGVVVGTQIIRTINGAPADGELTAAIQEYCMYLTGRSEVVSPAQPSLCSPTIDLSPGSPCLAEKTTFPSHFGQYGGQYVPELLLDSLQDLEQCFANAKVERDFWEEYQSHLTAMTGLSRALVQTEEKRCTSSPGASIWLQGQRLHDPLAIERYRLYSTLGQTLLARRLGKKRILAETTSEGDAVATATVCARLGLECILFMGARDLKRFPDLPAHIDNLGGKVVSADSGGQGVRNAINLALQFWIANLHDCHYAPSFAIGPHPFPTIVRTFQARFGHEMREEAVSQIGKSPDVVVVSMAPGDAAIALLPGFMDIVGIDVVLADPPGRLTTMSPGVFHGSWTEVQQDKDGQVAGEGNPKSHGYHSYPSLEPELSYWVSVGKAQVVSCDHQPNSSADSPTLADNRVMHVGRQVAAGVGGIAIEPPSPQDTTTREVSYFRAESMSPVSRQMDSAKSLFRLATRPLTPLFCTLSTNIS
ncbi:tryptophan synthetase [Aspergillus nanangensis]|uniref:tryptophan synthase n=1 Tax=Aspergillus nanangensis TaxID=2582783 RepID=A0AAD4GQ06_ASPNN|nr:tryptophan synthetase [Aspergillus nanangensis]